MSLSIDSPRIAQLQALARDHQTAIVYGFTELLDSRFYNCALLAHLMDSRVNDHKRILTPELDVRYRVPDETWLARRPMLFACPWCPNGRYDPPGPFSDSESMNALGIEVGVNQHA